MRAPRHFPRVEHLEYLSPRSRWISRTLADGSRDRFYTLLYTRETRLTHGIQEVIQRIVDEFRGRGVRRSRRLVSLTGALRARFSRIVSDPRRAAASRVIREN